MFYLTERTEKVPMGSIKNVVSEPLEGHEDYHMMVSVLAAPYTVFVCCKKKKKFKFDLITL